MKMRQEQISVYLYTMQEFFNSKTTQFFQTCETIAAIKLGQSLIPRLYSSRSEKKKRFQLQDSTNNKFNTVLCHYFKTQSTMNVPKAPIKYVRNIAIVFLVIGIPTNIIGFELFHISCLISCNNDTSTLPFKFLLQ